ncbi:MAG: HlyD family efflux transporter periplasmic adaptor subunit [Methylomicrobium sp.]
MRRRNRRLKGISFAILLTGVVFFMYWWFVNRGWVGTDDAFVMGHLITVKTLTGGTIVEIAAENTQKVNVGDLLVRLDGTHAEVAFQEAKAELAETVREIATLDARIDMLTHRILGREASLQTVRHDLQRYRIAALDGAVSEQKVQNAIDRIRELEAAISEAKAEKTGLEAQLLDEPIERHPSVEKAKSRLRRAYLDYRRSNIVAPISGYIANRRTHVGDHVNAGAPLLTIVPLDEIWVEANFLETQIAEIRPGQSAHITIDAYGRDIVYHGKVEGISPGTGSAFAILPTNNATGNFIHIAERVPVRIGLEPDELRRNPLPPGLSTYTRIHIGEPGKPLLTSTASVASPAYRTPIFDNELDEADGIIKAIITENHPGPLTLRR